MPLEQYCVSSLSLAVQPELWAKDEELLDSVLDEETAAEELLPAFGNSSSMLGYSRGGLSEQDKRRIAANRGRKLLGLVIDM